MRFWRKFDVRRVRVKPGDVVVFQIRKPSSSARVEQLTDQINNVAKEFGWNVVVLTDAVDISVVECQCASS